MDNLVGEIVAAAKSILLSRAKSNTQLYKSCFQLVIMLGLVTIHYGNPGNCSSLVYGIELVIGSPT